jgi:type IV pilus assembly protein PilM
VQLSNLISRIRGESKTIGLDIGHRLITVAVVEHRPFQKGTLTALEQEALPEGVLVDNEIKNLAVLTDKVQTVLARAVPGSLDGDFVASVNWTSGILCDRILVKPVPKVPENELILQAAMGRSPFDDAGNVLDFSIVGRRSEGIEAMIVAAKKDSLSSWVNLFRALNVKLAAIDVDAFALSNVCFLSHNRASSVSDDDEDAILLLNIGYSKSYLAFLHNGSFNTARSIMGCSMQDFQEQISTSLGISAKQASSLLMGGSVRDLGLDEDKAKSTMEFIFDEISMKIDTALRYFSSLDNYRKASRMGVAGGSGVKGLVSYLSDKFSLEAFALNPFKAVKVDSKVSQETDLTSMAGVYSVAVGLALRKF